LILFLITGIVIVSCSEKNVEMSVVDSKVNELIGKMTLDEKIGQLVQKNGDGFSDSLIIAGGLGSILNPKNLEDINRVQKIAKEQSRLGIPILFARDVIHGYKTIMPIPLGLASTWNTELVKAGARVAATEAASKGIRWTFSPMIDVSRDPRWGRIAEGFGEDTYLTSLMGVAMIHGYQGENLADKTSIAACAKHLAAYGWAEGGRDYNSANISEYDLRDVVLPPFKMASDAGALSMMTSFNDISGVPATGNKKLVNNILREEWGFEGLVVSDWVSIIQICTHGVAENNKVAARLAMDATVDMDMASPAYETHLKELINEKVISEKQIDEAVARILKVKFLLGLFDNPYTNTEDFPALLNDNHLQVAKQAAIESAVLLKNQDNILPIKNSIKKVAIIGPLANSPHDQMGTWVFDGEKKNSVTPLTSLLEYGEKNGVKIIFEQALEISRSKAISNPASVAKAAREADVVLLFLGEESILSGESHCLANIDLPGAQEELVKLVQSNNPNTVAIIMAGRPVTFEPVLDKLKGIVYFWHPGTMGGPAITDLLFGTVSPSGKLPVTFPRHVGQIPIYYNFRNTGKPANDGTWERYDDIPVEAPQLSIGNTSHYLDYGFEPMYPFGFGLSYSSFEYKNLKLDKESYAVKDRVKVTVELTNTGEYDASETVQLYIRDVVASRARPLKELKGFQKIFLKKGESRLIEFLLDTDQLAFYNIDMLRVVEPGEFHVFVGGSSADNIMETFAIE
jgi:beta-glucosidase